MSFSDHKITQFTHKITDLPDQPNLPADELKARFDSSPEELRQAHNALCDDADRLDDRVSGIIAETFGDAIPKSMLADELQDEIDAKATQTALAAEVNTLEAADSAEAAARTAADDDLQDQIDAHTETLAEKVEIYIGTFQKPSGSNDVYLPFTPQAVIFMPNGTNHTCLLLPSKEANDENGDRIAILIDNRINFPSAAIPSGETHAYIAIK